MFDEFADDLRWQPSEERMAAFRAREVELCVGAIRKGVASAQVHTLFSQSTWDAAIALLTSKERADRLAAQPAPDLQRKR